MNLTTANQLTILRMLLIPAFVILLVYGYRGWALVTFMVAGLTDLLDGLIARLAGKKPRSARGWIRWRTSCSSSRCSSC